ncbi:hypothetical protein D4764_08G0011320 [Takifugu flavidus]|uniref:Uncharacterized protein n=1 Tax=Takifugu flavidus TaxID=433684 RepID=A0A5C6MQT6_9TELE|nr:hypothetical protein D4764_08G0011320 [Takifugu flavidus]
MTGGCWVLQLRDDKPVQEEDWVLCQHPECAERRRASKCVYWIRAGSS